MNATAREVSIQTLEHKVVIRGSAVSSQGIDPIPAGAFLMRLEHGLRGAVDMAFRGASTAGRRQGWLQKAARVALKKAERVGKEEMAFYFEAPVFADVAEQFYEQPRLFDDAPDSGDTAFDIFADAAADVLARKADSNRYDVGLLKRFGRYSSIFDRRVAEVIVTGHRLNNGHTCRLSSEFPTRADELYKRTPESARARIAGKLDMIEASTFAFTLLLPSGERVRGVWKGTEFETLRNLVNSDVAATGMAVYRPSGLLLRIDADVLTPQQSGDQIFAMVPKPMGTALDIKALLRAQEKKGGMAAIGGQVPAEESDDEFLAMLASTR